MKYVLGEKAFVGLRSNSLLLLALEQQHWICSKTHHQGVIGIALYKYLAMGWNFLFRCEEDNFAQSHAVPFLLLKS